MFREVGQNPVERVSLSDSRVGFSWGECVSHVAENAAPLVCRPR